MSITTNILGILMDADYNIDDAMGICQAMERGPDRDIILSLADHMLELDQEPEVIAAALVAVAAEILVAARFSYAPSRPDPYKERLGMSPKAWRKLRDEVLAAKGCVCTYCGSDSSITVDHVVPLSKGGTNEIDNLTPACKPCNSSKRDRLLGEWVGRA